MTAALTTQVAIEALILPNPAGRTSQVALEVLVAPPNPMALLSQVAVEVLIKSVTAGDACAVAWTFPTINPYPVVANGGPQWRRFEELEPDWGTFGVDWYDGAKARNTMQSAGARRWVIEYDSLDRTQAAILDAHNRSTRGRIGFTLQEPNTGETLSGVRYAKYENPGHKRTWAQTRLVELVKYPA